MVHSATVFSFPRPFPPFHPKIVHELRACCDVLWDVRVYQVEKLPARHTCARNHISEISEASGGMAWSPVLLTMMSC